MVKFKNKMIKQYLLDTNIIIDFFHKKQKQLKNLIILIIYTFLLWFLVNLFMVLKIQKKNKSI